MRTNRRKLLGALAGTGFVGVAGCVGVEEDDPDDGAGADDGNGDGNGNGDDGEEATVAGEAEFWYALSEGELEIVEDALGTFNDETDYLLDGSDIAELEDRLVSAIPAGEGPEIFMWAHDWVGDFADSQFIVDQGEDLDVDLDQFTDAGRNAIQYQGGVYGLPVSAETVALIYNEEMVDEPPETIDEMQEIMEEYHDPANNQYGLSYPMDPYFYSAYAHAFGGYYFDDADESLGLTMDETIRGFEVVLEELDPYSPNDPEYDPQAAAFVEGNAPLAINGPWFLGDVEFEASVAALPAPDGGEPAPYSGVSMIYFADAITDEADRGDAARTFAEWYTTNTDVLTRLAEDQGYIPVHEDLAGSDDLPDTVQGFSESAATGVPMPTNAKMNQVWGPLEDAFMNAYTGDQSLEDAMVDAEDRIRDNWD